jgi:co-chaperonin GroES (HSP10)
MKPLREASIDTDPESIIPFGDFVLVRPEEPADNRNGIAIPESARASEKEYGLQTGTVVACGPGDRALWCYCNDCEARYTSTLSPRPEGDPNCGAVRVVYGVATCPRCDSSNREMMSIGHPECRRPMHVKPGDTVVFPRVPANRLVIQGEEYVILHEEQHCWAVLE